MSGSNTTGTDGSGGLGSNDTAGAGPERAHDAPPHSRWAIAAVICAGLSFSFLPVIGIVLGFAFASRAERAIQDEPGSYVGMDAVRWARRLAWLGVVLCAISAISVGFAWWAMNG